MDIIWDQTGFEKLLESLPAKRLKEDKQTLTAIFNKAAKSPTLKAELQWAKKHGIKFFVDHTCQTAEGYYQLGTGVVAIAKNRRFMTDVEILAHEIRHAWQDYHGLIQDDTKQDFLSYYSQLSITEADATAFQKTAKYEYNGGAKTTDWGWADFTSWYSSLAVTYGSAAARQYAQKIGLDGTAPPDYRVEFASDLPPIRRQPDISVQEAFPLLNKDFSGKEYFNAAAAPDFLKKITDHSAAAKFYQDYLKEPDKLVQAICVKQGLDF